MSLFSRLMAPKFEVEPRTVPVVVSEEEIASPIASSPEFVVAMNYPSMIKYQNMVKSGGTMFLNSDLITESRLVKT